MEFFVQTACNNKLTANISDWLQKSSIRDGQLTRQNSLTRIKKLLKDLRNNTSTVSYGLKLSVELILYLLTDLHLKQTKLALVQPDPYQQLIEGQSFHYTAHSKHFLSESLRHSIQSINAGGQAFICMNILH